MRQGDEQEPGGMGEVSLAVPTFTHHLHLRDQGLTHRRNVARDVPEPVRLRHCESDTGEKETLNEIALLLSAQFHTGAQ
jgi:hypothetical protein